MDQSFQLPFADGKEKKVAERPIAHNFSEQQFLNFQRYLEMNEVLTPEEYQDFVDIMNFISEYEIIPNELKAFEGDINDYFMDSSTEGEKLTEATKNIVSYYLHDISNSVVNSMASDTPVTSDTTAAVASKSEKARDAKLFSMDNYMTLPAMKQANSYGKDCIGISAVGLKCFNTLSFMYSKKMSNLEKELIQKGITPDARVEDLDQELVNQIWHDLNIKKVNLGKRDYNKLTRLKDRAGVLTNEAINKELKNFFTGLEINGDDIVSINNVNYRLNIVDGYKYLSPLYENAKSIDLSKRNDDLSAIVEEAALFIELLNQTGVNPAELALSKIEEETGVSNFIRTQAINIADYTGDQNLLIEKYKLSSAIINANLVANVNFTNTPILNNIYGQFVKNNNIIDVRLTADKSLDMSELVTISTDNAKELILEKINASPALIGVYSYLTSIGLPLDVIADYMISKEVNTIASLAESNVFTGDNMNVDKAIAKITGIPYYRNYLKGWEAIKLLRGPKKSNSKTSMLYRALEAYKKHRSTSIQDAKIATSIQNNLGDYEKVKLGQLFSEFNKLGPNALKALADVIKDDYPKLDSKIKHGMKRYENAIRESVSYKEDLDMDFINAFAELYLGADELKLFGSRLNINQGMKTTAFELISGYNRYNNTVARFAKKRDLDLMELSSKVNLDGSQFDISNIYTGKQTKELTDLYDALKIHHNIVEAEIMSPSFSSMHLAKDSAVNILRNSSAKFKALELMYKTFGQYANEDNFKDLMDFLNKDITNLYLSNLDLDYNVKKDSEIYKDEDDKKIKTERDSVISIKSKNGVVNFKILMEKRLQDLKKLYPENQFLSNIGYDSIADKLTRAEYTIMKPNNLNMNSILSDTDIYRYSQMVNGFKELTSIKSDFIDGMNISDEFMLYNLIINNNGYSKSSFSRFFDEAIDSDSENIISDYMRFVGNLDYSSHLSNKGESEFEWANESNYKTYVSDDKEIVYNSTINSTYLNLLHAQKVGKEFKLDFKSNGDFVKKWNNTSKSFDFYRWIGTGNNGAYEKIKNLGSLKNAPSFLTVIKNDSNNVINNSRSRSIAKELQRDIDNNKITLIFNC
jgi:hypothetical protein